MSVKVLRVTWVRIASSVRGFIISDIEPMYGMVSPRTLEAMRIQEHFRRAAKT